MKISDSRFGAMMSMPGLAVVLLLVLFPIIVLVIVSFLQWDIIHPRIFCGLDNYKATFQDGLFWSSLKRALIYCGGVTSITFIVGLILAVFLSRITKGASIFRTLSMFPWAVPLVISGYIWKWMFDPEVGIISAVLMNLGILSEPLNTFANPTISMIAVILADAWTRIPFFTVFVLAGLESVPRELYEVACVDGADFFDSLFHITLPLIARTTLVALLIISMFSLRTVDVVLSMTQGGPGRATYVIGLYVVDQLWKKVNLGYCSAASIILFLISSVMASVYIHYTLKSD